MAELKTKRTGASVDEFLATLADEGQRQDCRVLLELMTRLTGRPAEMWGASIVGFGDYRYRYASGREGDWFAVGFAPRKREISIYLMPGLEGHEALLAELGKHRTGVGCLYFKRLADVDVAVLERLVAASLAALPQGSAGAG
jgi:hypothetical protein